MTININILLDENVPPSAKGLFSDFGYTCFHIQDLNLKGASDEVVLKKSLELKACLCTCNGKDFVIQLPPVCKDFNQNHFGLYWNMHPQNWTRLRNLDIVTCIHESIANIVKKSETLTNRRFAIKLNKQNIFYCYELHS